ncbi:MAG: hypothetical protein LBT00_00730 [Spirochaetaceae bacterium]|jgi:hypothetical protein|nr:hypothetical protein [Spirochaetaceae bacterium]
MFVKAVLFLLLEVILAVSCATKQFDESQFGETIAVSQPRSYTIIEHKNLAGDIPQWLQRYLDSGERLVEAAADYSGDYIFVTTEKGSGLAALEKWSEYFRVEQDFSQAVFLRMYNRLVAESGGRPDYYLGDFFEVFLKKIAGHTFAGATREYDYWIKVSFERDSPADVDAPDESGAESADSETGEEYRYYILSKINKVLFEKEIMILFSAAQSEVTLEKAQAGAVSRLQNTVLSRF